MTFSPAAIRADADAVGRPAASRGEVPVAVVVRSGELDGHELLDWVAERTAPHKRMRAVRFVEAIPRTPSGKLLGRAPDERAASLGPA